MFHFALRQTTVCGDPKDILATKGNLVMMQIAGMLSDLVFQLFKYAFLFFIF